jgi:hypothetical protein
MKFNDILKETFANKLGDPLNGRENACFSSLYKAQQLLVDALRLIETAYQECDDEEKREEIIEFKKDLMHDFGHNGTNGFGHDEEDGDENENNLINRISNFIDKNSPEHWDSNIHLGSNPNYKNRN